MTKEDKRRDMLYKYLIFRKERELEWFIESMEGTEENFRKVHVMIKRICDLEFKAKNIRNGRPVNGYCNDFEIQCHGDIE